MPKVSVIMPVYNVERFVGAAVRSVLEQTFEDFELLVINDVTPDRSVEICEKFRDPRLRVIHHRENRGLAGARNTGIRHASGDYLAFIDSDDCWHPEKLERHLQHLERDPRVGVSFSRSAFMDEDGTLNRCYQMPRLTDIEPGYYLCRNPIGNGSAPVIRRQVFDQIRYRDAVRDTSEHWYFDENLRQSEDIECWIRIALTTRWVIEGIPEPLTYYRHNAGGLSANLLRQLESWERVIEKTRGYAPDFIKRWEQTARAFQLRYLARQAIRLEDGRMALQLGWRALHTDPSILRREPGRTLVTLGAALLLRLLPIGLYRAFETLARKTIGRWQSGRIRSDLREQAHPA